MNSKVSYFSSNDAKFRTLFNLMHIETAAIVLSTAKFIVNFEEIFFGIEKGLCAMTICDNHPFLGIFLFIATTLPNMMGMLAIRMRVIPLIQISILSSFCVLCQNTVYAVYYVNFLLAVNENGSCTPEEDGYFYSYVRASLTVDYYNTNTQMNVGILRRFFLKFGMDLVGERTHLFYFGIKLSFRMLLNLLVIYALIRVINFIKAKSEYEYVLKIVEQQTTPDFDFSITQKSLSSGQKKANIDIDSNPLQQQYRRFIFLNELMVHITAVIEFLFSATIFISNEQFNARFWTGLHLCVCMLLVVDYLFLKWKRRVLFILAFVAINVFAMIDLVNVGIWLISGEDIHRCYRRKQELFYCHLITNDVFLLADRSICTYLTTAIEQFLIVMFAAERDIDEATKKDTSAWTDRQNPLYIKFSILQELFTIFVIFTVKNSLFHLLFTFGKKKNYKPRELLVKCLIEAYGFTVGFLVTIYGYKMQEFYGFYLVSSGLIFFGVIFKMAKFFVPFIVLNGVTIFVRTLDLFLNFNNFGKMTGIYLLLIAYLIALEFTILMIFIMMRKMSRIQKKMNLNKFIQEIKDDINVHDAETRFATLIDRRQAIGVVEKSNGEIDDKFILNNSGNLYLNGRTLKFNTDQLINCRLLGQGSNRNRVFKCKLLSYEGYSFVVKLMSFSNENRRRVCKDIATNFGCNSPYIVTCHGYLIKEHFAVICMELMSQSLEHLISSKGKLDEKQLIDDVGLRVARGMLYLKEEKQVIHGDIKPLNILLDQRGRAKLADFDTSAQLVDSIAVASQRHGEFHLWIAPERIGNASDFDIKSDIWSLGMSLLQASIGHYPLEHGDLSKAEEVENLKQRMKNGEAKVLAEGLVTDGRIVSNHCYKECLETIPDQRPSLRELIDVLCFVDAFENASSMLDRMENEKVNLTIDC